ncbi:hypothetical protein MKX03_036065, partial [Papaver bracteatum]
GLNELFESYSITSGTFLVLKYEGISQFKVCICQLSGKEVDYSSFHNNDTDVYHIEASDEDSDNDDSEDDNNDEEREEFRDDPMRKKNRSITHGGLRTQERAIEIERGFKSSRNNPFFAIGLQPSYVSHKFLSDASSRSARQRSGPLLRFSAVNIFRGLFKPDGVSFVVGT